MGATHRRRLREVWRSAGWPCHDAIELDLLATGLLSRHWDADGRETLRLTDAGIHLLAATRRRNQAAFDAHEALVARVALEMQRAGRIVWRGLSLRAPLPRDDGGTTWAMAIPDVYSIRHTTLEDQVEPIAHEIKVSRADLLSDLRRQAKAAAYLAVASQCWYVLREGIASADEVPAAYGVIFAGAHGLDVARAAPRRPLRLPLAVWMALARAAPERRDDDEPQEMLGDSAAPPDGGGFAAP
ncbi:MAG: hypothetical protein IPF94_02820 [Betaproteobacteria bacterium]|nr:hypothetical protein [Betaproteobacteria bacterium]